MLSYFPERFERCVWYYVNPGLKNFRALTNPGHGNNAEQIAAWMPNGPTPVFTGISRECLRLSGRRDPRYMSHRRTSPKNDWTLPASRALLVAYNRRIES